MTERVVPKLEQAQAALDGGLRAIAEHASDPTVASDVAFAANVSAVLMLGGGRPYVVGGFVRDMLLGRQPKDVDLEVYGLPTDYVTTMASRFGDVHEVGASFGVIKVINPTTRNALDISLPRREVSTGESHTEYSVDIDCDMDPAEAVRRRDLTINALLMNPITGEITDPSGGLGDMQLGVLRAVDLTTFGEDPLRVLRVIRLASQLGFAPDSQTLELCSQLDVSSVAKERVAEEWNKLLLTSPTPSNGLRLAKEIGLVDALYPQLAQLENTPQDPEWHPEGDVWVHTLLTLDAAARAVGGSDLSDDQKLVVLYGALCHDLGKPQTTEVRDVRGRSRITAHAHGSAGIDPTKSFLHSIGVKPAIIAQVVPIVKHHLWHYPFFDDSPDASAQLPDKKAINRLAKLLQPASIELWALVSGADENGRGQQPIQPTKADIILTRARELGADQEVPPMIVQGRDLIAQGHEAGPALGGILRQLHAAQLDGGFDTVEDGIAYYHRMFRDSSKT